MDYKLGAGKFIGACVLWYNLAQIHNKTWQSLSKLLQLVTVLVNTSAT